MQGNKKQGQVNQGRKGKGEEGKRKRTEKNKKELGTLHLKRKEGSHVTYTTSLNNGLQLEVTRK